jgi:small subunit ribosomal protein S11
MMASEDKEQKQEKSESIEKEVSKESAKLKKEDSKSKKTKTSVPESKENKSNTESKSPTVKERKSQDQGGIAHIYSSGNNTIIHITDLAGNTISRVSGGMVTKHSRLKANPTIAMFVAKKASERAKDLGISELYIRTKGKTNSTGIGPGAHAAVKSLGKEGFRIVNILDVTKVPRGGPKQKGGRRGRRV